MGVLPKVDGQGDAELQAAVEQDPRDLGCPFSVWTCLLTYRTGECKNSVGFCALIEQIVQAYCPGEDYAGPKIGLVVDNYIIHRSKKTTAVLE